MADADSTPLSLRVICAWCMTTLRPGPADVSHGTCKTCSERVWSGEPRLKLVAHLREQIAADPDAYANPAKLAVVAERLRGVV